MAATAAQLTRRTAISALAAAGAGFIVFGPRGREHVPTGRLVLDYWEKWTQHEGRAMQAVVDEFNASQSRLFVRYLVTGTIHQKALIAIAGGNPPDIIGMYNYNVPAYADAAAVLPLGDLAPRHGLRLDHYAPGVRQVMQHRGRWWATVNTAGTLALYYNKRLFSEAGLNPEQPPRTIQELDAAHAALTRVTAGEVQRAGFLHMEPGWWSWIWGYHFGDTLYDEATDRSLAANPTNIRAYDWMQSYPRHLGVDAVERFRSGLGPYGQANWGFLTGELAMVVQGPWMASQVNQFAPDLDYGVAPFPVDESIYEGAAPPPTALIDTDVLMIPRGAKNPEASMEFIAYTQQPRIAERLATAHCKGSPMLDVSESFLAAHPNRGVRLHTELFSSPRAFICPPTGAWPELKDIFDTAMSDLWKLREPAAQRLAAVQSASQAVLDRAARTRQLRGESTGLNRT
ncbi:MAG: ABC transporter substrate-binding protein [Phycisphaerales bacterium]|nr:ABC transporter substrate-binding protein [Phycisphaerales bacterium]